MTTFPPYLQPGDTIAIVCPAGYMPLDRALVCIDTLNAWGYKVKPGRTLGGTSTNYFSGTDDERLADLQQALDDPDIKAILCGRGGYGLTRIIDRIDFSRFIQRPKWIIGYSDITVLHAHIQTNFNIATLHAPMAAAFLDGGAQDPYVQSLHSALKGEMAEYTCASHPFNRIGQAKAPLTGGNLALLSHLVGSPSSPVTAGHILFIEDVGEYAYNIDRMLRQLKRSGRLDRLAGLIVGSFTDGKDTVRPFGASIAEIIRDVILEYDYPVCFGFPVGHSKKNVALVEGDIYTLKVTNAETRLTRSAH